MKSFTHIPNPFGKLLLSCFFLFIYLLPADSQAQTTQTFTTSGSFVVPAGVTSVQVQAWGGGGAGGGVVGGALFTAKAGGGGAGGSFTKVTNVAVTPGATITVTVGAGGTGASQVAGTTGGTSTFGSAIPVSAVGGGGGQIGTNGTGAAVTTGITFNGGSGGNAVSANSGAGGGGAGSTGAGGNASGTTAGTAGPGGGSAGAAGLTSSGDGITATGIAGGGSGGKSASTISGTARKGGNGAPGQVLVIYTCPTYSLTSTSASGPFCSASSSVVTLTSSTLTEGPYVVTYDLSGGNNSTGLTANMTIPAGSPGSGTFSTPILNGSDTPTTITVTNIKSGAAGALCSSAITANRTANVQVTVPNLSAGTPFTKTCVNNPSGAPIGESPESGYSYSWNPAAGLSDASISNPIANPTATTTYTVTKTNTISGCNAAASVTITVDNTLTVNAGADFTKTCTVNPSGKVIGETNVSGNTYSWSPSAGLSSDSVSNPTANPTVTTTYTVTKTNVANGCVATDDIVVTVNVATPVADAGADFTKTCVTNSTGAAIGEATQSGNTYLWSPTTGLSSSTVSNPTANPTVTTTYTVTKTDSGSGCTNTDSVTVTVDTTAPTVAALTGTQIVCAGSTVVFSSTTGGGTWTTSNGAVATVNAGTVTGVSAGTATISYTVTGANGCSTTVTRVVTVNPLPASVTASGAAAICNGSSTLLTGSAVIPYILINTITQDNFNGTPIFTGAGSGTPFAQKTSGTLVGVTTITNNVDASKFMMASQSSAFSNATTASTLTSPSFSTTGYVTPLTLTFNHSYQKGDTGTNNASIQVSIDGGTTWVAVKSYTANQGANNNFVAETVNLDAYLNKANCKIRFNTTISTYLGTGWWAIENVVLKGTVGVVPLYSWIADTPAGVNGLPAGAATPSTGNASISVNPSTNTNYTLVAQDSLNGCTQNATPVQVIVNPIPTADRVANGTYCNGVATTAIPLTGSPSGVTFDISGGASIGLADATGVTAIPAFNSVAGSANVSITPKANGCTGSPVVYHVTVNQTPAVNNPGSQNYCDGAIASSIVLNGTPLGVTYDISGGAAVGLADVTNVTTVPSFTAVAGSANISITPHANGCTGSAATYSIAVNPNATPQFNAVPSSCSGAALNPLPTVSNNGITGVWTPGLNNMQTTEYTFHPDAGQCTSATLVKLTIAINSNVTYYADSDNDTYGDANNTIQSCHGVPTGYSANNTDCNDANAAQYQSASLYIDSDGDGYDAGQATVCYGATLPSGYSSATSGTDCNDNDSAKYQSALLYIDSDADGYDAGQATVCYGATAPVGYSATTLGTDCNDASFSLTNNCSTTSVVNLKMFVEGYYDQGAGTMRSVRLNQAVDPTGISDTDVEDMTVELHDADTYGLIATTTAMLHTDGTMVCNFTTAPSGSFYIAIKGRNIVETWSGTPQLVGTTTLNYDFSTSATQAYGDNMSEISSGIWAIYSGDINQDGVIDGTDSTDLINDIENAAFGDTATDMNGDGAVDNSDATNYLNNLNNNIYSIHP